MRQYIDTLQDVQGNALVGATVLVQNYIGGANASIFSDNGLTPILTSTVATGADGQFSFFAADGNYTLVMSKNATIFKTQSPVVLFDGAAQLSFTDTGAANAYAVSNSDLEKALRSGLRASFVAANTNTGASTFAYNGLAAKSIVLPGGAALTGGLITVGGIYGIEYDGTNWELKNFSFSASTIGLALYPQSAAEAAASVTPVNYFYPPGVVDRYATNTSAGTTDMTSAFTIAASCNVVVIAPYGPYRILTGPIVVSGNRTFIGQLGGDFSAQATQLIHDAASSGPLFQAITTDFGSIYIGHFDVSGGNGTCAVLTSRPQSTIEYIHMEGTSGYNGHGIITLGGLTLTGTVAGGATSATLTDPWTAYTGVFSLTFSTADVRNVTLTNGATTVTWTGGLSGLATALPVFSQGAWENTIHACKHVAPHSGGTPTANNYRSFIVNNSGGNTTVDHCISAYSSVGMEVIQGQNITIRKPDCNTNGVNATDSASNGQCGIRIAGSGYKQSIGVEDPWVEGCITSIWVDKCTGATIDGTGGGFIDDLGNTNTPAININSALALNTRVANLFVQVRNSAAALACLSNAGTNSLIENNTWNANNAAATQKTVINTTQCVFLNNVNASTNFGTLSDASGLIQDITPRFSNFVPLIGGSTTAGVQTYSLNQGYGWFIGRRFHFDIVIIMTAKDGATAGNLQVTGLPVASRNNAAGRVYNATLGGHSNLTFTAGNQITATVANAGTVITLFQSGTGLAQAALAAAALNATSAIYLSGSYDT
jgi:hypothetical protein